MLERDARKSIASDTVEVAVYEAIPKFCIAAVPGAEPGGALFECLEDRREKHITCAQSR